MKQVIFGQLQRLFEINNNSFTPIVVSAKINPDVPLIINNFISHGLTELKTKTLYLDLLTNDNNPNSDLSLFFDNKLLLDELIIEQNHNLHKISLNQSFSDKLYNYDNLNYLTESLKKISSYYDIILINYNAVIDEYFLALTTMANFLLLSITPSVKDIMDAYSVVKLLLANNIDINVLIQIYNSEDDEDANIAFMNLNKATLHFLNREMIFAGNLNKGINFNHTYNQLEKKYQYQIKSSSKFIIENTIKKASS